MYIKNIDADTGRITADDEEIPGSMSAMEMTEAVSDAKMLETSKTGDKIEFELARTGSNLVTTKLNKIGEVAVVNGGAIYKMNCAECRGDLSNGTTKEISLLEGHRPKHTEMECIEQVTNSEEKKMPAVKDKLSAEQVAAAVKFVREELQKNEEITAEHKH